MEAAVKELKQKAQQATASAEQSTAQRAAAAQEITKLEALAAELKEQLQKAGSAQVPLFLGLGSCIPCSPSACHAARSFESLWEVILQT